MKIQIMRKRKGLSQTNLAKMCETTQQQIAKIEGCIVDPRLSTLRRIADSLKVELNDLFYGKEEFIQVLNDLINEEGLKSKKIALASLNSLAFQIKKIPIYHPFWEIVKIKNNKVFFMEEKNI